MPPVDLESIVRNITVCGDSKVACETTLIKPANPNPTYWNPDSDSDSDSNTGPHPDPDFPAESYCIKIGDDFSWDDINPVYDRDDSTKGTTNPKSSGHQPFNSNPTNTNSKRFGGNLKATAKAPIIALPQKINHQHLSQSTRKPRARVFVPKSCGGGGGGRGVVLVEPRSPEVSCFGKVLSQREQRCRRRRRSPEVSCFGRVFGCFGPRRSVAQAEEEEEREESRSPASGRSSTAAAVGLGGMRRFESRRRPASWGGDVEVDVEEEGHVAWSGPLDR